jgi:hypothetical protein
MKRVFTLCFFILTAATVQAQGSIKGKLTDTATKSALSLATITVFKAADTSLITYRLSNPEGEFKVSGLPLNIGLRAVISFTGYAAYRHEFTLTDENVLDLGTIGLNPTSHSLDEVFVTAERPPVSVKRDTIEFNASSFKTLPTALVEDLLRKLPGVQVDAEGNITANGKRVNRILVDGKAFFGDDPKMATRNLPANVIDKVQVTEDKDEANRNTTGDLTNVGQVINLTFKKGIKKGWFGKAYAGAGTKERYEIGGIANIYRDTMQLSLLAFSNNMNRSGFSFKEIQDLAGFNRSGSNSMMVMSRGGQSGFAINGISFGGLDAGVARTTGAGFNLNHAPDKKKSFFLQYFFGNTRNHVEMTNNNQQFLSDTSVNTRTNSNTDRDAFTHNVSTGFKLKPDTLTDVDLRATYSRSSSDEEIANLIKVDNNKTGQISKSAGNQFNDFATNRYNHSLFLTRRARSKKGRVWNMYNFFNYNRNALDYITEADNEFYVPSRFDQEFNQLRSQRSPSLSSNTSLSYAEPLTKDLTLRFNNRHEYLKDKQDISIFSKNFATAKYELMNYAQSSGFEREQNRFSSYLGLTYKIKQVTMSAGLSGLWQHIDNRYRNITNPIRFDLFNLLPSASFQWKQLSANYSMNVSAPSINYLMPVPDSTNPFYIRYGNPYLKPARQHQFYVSNYNFFQGSGSSFNIWGNGNITDDDVIAGRTVKSNGVQVERPVNGNGTVSFYTGMSYGQEFKNKQKFIFSYRVSTNLNYNQRKLLVNENLSTARTLGFGPAFNIGLNWNDIVEFRPMYSFNVNRTRYTDPYFKNIEVLTHYVESELIVRWPKKLVWETNVAYRNTTQVAPGLPKTNVLWNAAVTLLMLKGDVGLLKLSVFDILDRNNTFYRYTTQNQITDNQTNTLNRFAALSFTYNIRNLGAPKKVGGRDRLFMF